MSRPVHVAVPDGYRDHMLDIARRVRRLHYNPRDPERMHLDKDELAHEIEALARRSPYNGR